MKYSKLSAAISTIPLIVVIFWLILGMYFLNNTVRRNYTSTFLLIELTAIIVSCYYSLRSLKEKNSVYKIIGISLSCFYVLVIVSMVIINIIDIYNIEKNYH